MNEGRVRGEKQERPEEQEATEVMIDGQLILLTGGDEDYLRKVASYINGKLSELKQGRQYSRRNSNYRKLMLWLNLADDYMKEKAVSERLRREAETHEAEVYTLKREIVEKRLELEKADSRLKQEQAQEDALKKHVDEMQKRIAELEKEIDEFLSK